MLSKRAIKGLYKIGDIMIPGDGEFPSFSSTECLKYVDDVVAYAPKEDISLLNTFLVVFSFLPSFIQKWIVGEVEEAHLKDYFLSPLFRQLFFGLKGIVYGLYYGGKMGNTSVKNPEDLLNLQLTRIEN